MRLPVNLITLAWVAGVVLGMPRAAMAQPCGGGEIVLRDSIGPDNTTTNGNYSYDSVIPTQAPVVVVFPVTSDQAVFLTTIRAIGSQTGGTSGATECWSNPNYDCDYKIAVWSSFLAVQANNHNGDLANLVLEDPTVGHTQWGQTGVWQPGSRIFTTFDATYDISSMSVTLAPGETKWLALLYTHSMEWGCGQVESTEAGASDYQVYSDGTFTEIVTDQTGYPRSLHGGRMAFKVTATTLPPLPGDVNLDHALTSADVPAFVGILLDPASASPAQRCAADFDHSGVVDGGDIPGFTEALTSP